MGAMSISFGEFELDRERRQLLRSSQPVSLEPKAYELLCLLVERRPRALSRAQIRDAIWPGTFISESTLGVVVNGIRQALGDDARQPRFVRTIHGFGYAFCGEAREGDDGNEIDGIERSGGDPSLVAGPATEDEERGAEERALDEASPAPERVVSLPAASNVAAVGSRALRWGAAVTLMLAVALGTWLLSRRGAPPPAEAPRIVPFTTDGGYKRHPKLSPDGEKVAYEWQGDIYVKAIGVGTRPFRLTEHEAREVGAVWSPDGRLIAFVRMLEGSAAIYTVPSLGGQERKVIDGPVWSGEGPYDYAPTLGWSPDGEWLVFAEKAEVGEPARIVRLSLETLEKQPLTSPAEGTLGDVFPELSPDGRLLAFARRVSARPAGNVDIWVQPVRGGSVRRLTSRRNFSAEGLAWTAAGDEVLFTADGATGVTTYRIGLDRGGEPQPVVGVTQNAGWVSIRRDRMVYEVLTGQPQDIWRVPGRRSPLVGRAPEDLIASTREDLNPTYSPDGRRIAFESDRSGVINVWVCDADGSNPVQVTAFKSYTGTPSWSPDGRNLAFDSVDGGDWNIYVIDAEGGLPRRLTSEPSDDFRPAWSRDGRWIYFASDRSGRAQIWRLPSGGGPAVQVTRGGGVYAEVSSDDRYLYYATEDAQASIRRVPVEGGEEVEVLRGPLAYAFDFALSPDGLYYSWKRASVESETYSIRFVEFASGRTTELLRKDGPFVHERLAVSPDEEWVLFGESPRAQSELMLMENFR
jgi:Tol biopolymer transport system component/DNA-binding winged helix-turn-helix (wHTH) protein